jgi:multidrug efflux pump subunit AcrB
MLEKLPPGRGLITYFARHRTLPNLLMVLMIILGALALTRMRAQYFPDVVQAEIVVRVPWSGAGAEDVDRGIIQLLEPALLVVDGVTNITSRATEGSGRITLEFEPGHDLGQAAEDVQTAVDQAGDLPEGTEDPVISRSNWRDQVTDVLITGPVSTDQLGRFADELVARLFAEGITRTTIQGFAAPETLVEVPVPELLRHDLTMQDIADAIAAETRASPAGELAGSARVRSGEAARDVAAISAIVLKSAPDGTKLTIGDVAQVYLTGSDRNRAFYVGDSPAMTVRVDRSADGDAVRMQAVVQAVAQQMQPSLPQGVKIELVRTRAEQITDRIDLMLEDGLQGMALVVLFLFLFLNAKAAFWVAMGIPVSVLAALAAMYVGGMTINMISLFALIITLGIVVDDAIVIAEHADYRARVLGENPQLAAENSANRMILPIMASTTTTIIAFAGLVVIGGRFGEIIQDIPWTVALVLIVSTAEGFLVLPQHMVHALRNVRVEAWYDWPSRQVLKGFYWFQHHIMRPFAEITLKARYVVLAGAVFLLATQVASFLRGDVPFRFFDAPEQSSVTGNFSMLPGADRADSMAMMRELQRAADAVATRYAERDGVSPVTAVIAQIGGGAGRSLSGAESKDADLLGGIAIELIDRDLRNWTARDFVQDLESEVQAVPLLEELSFRGAQFGPGGSAISVDLIGAEAETLKAAAEAIKTRLAQFPEVSGLEDTLAYDKDELVLTLTPQGQALGFSIDGIGASLRDMLGGIEAASFPDGPRSATIQVELPRAELTADFLDRTLMRASAGVYVPLSDIVTVTRKSGFSAILRENGARVVTVTGDLAEADPARAAAVQTELRQVILPAVTAEFGVEQRLSGLAAQEQEFLGDAGLGLGLALVGIFICLAWVFQSWTQPLVVMAVIPFGLIGAIWGHAQWDMPLTMFSIVGIIGMTGIIVNDSIVLIDTVNEYRPNRPLRRAIVESICDRLRPVFLTTVTTLVGMFPLLYQQSAQALFLKPTVISLVYGLGFGMVLVLMFIPALLAVQNDIARPLKSFWRMLKPRTHRRWRAARLRQADTKALSG